MLKVVTTSYYIYFVMSLLSCFVQDLEKTSVTMSPSSFSIPLTNFKWVHTDKQVIQVSYTARQEEQKSAVFTIKISANRPQSAYCNCLVQLDKLQTVRVACGGEIQWSHDAFRQLIKRPQIPCRGGGGERATEHLYPSEFVFMWDCSGSMLMFKDSVMGTLITAIKSLPKGCYFNMIAFGSIFRQLFYESKEYTSSTMKNAMDFAKQGLVAHHFFPL